MIVISAVIIYTNVFPCTYTVTSLTTPDILNSIWDIKMVTRRKLLISRTIHLDEFSVSFFLSNAKQLVIFGVFFFNACSPTNLKGWAVPFQVICLKISVVFMVCEMRSWKMSSLPRQNACFNLIPTHFRGSSKISLKCNVKARCCIECMLCWFEL